MGDTEKRLKICFLSSARYAHPLDATTDKKFRLLHELGDLFVIGFSSTLRPQCFTQHAHFTALPELPVPLLRYMLFFLLAPLLCLRLVLQHRISILVAQGPYEGAAAAFVKIVARWFGRPMILVIENHGDFEESLFMQRRVYFHRFYRAIMTMFVRFSLRYADLLRAVSNSTREQLERWKPGCRVFQFLAWTDIDVFFEVGSARKHVSAAAVLYAGVLIPRKGVIHLVNAFSRLADDFPAVSLYIVGKEDNHQYAKELKKAVAAFGLQQRVIFAGAVSQHELARFMAEAGIFVLPSYSEGLPRVVFEAMSAGLPVIATCVSGIPQVVQDGVTGFLIGPGDETALAEKLRCLLNNPDKREEMSRQAYSAAQTIFSTEIWLRGYREVVEAAQSFLHGERAR